MELETHQNYPNRTSNSISRIHSSKYLLMSTKMLGKISSPSPLDQKNLMKTFYQVFHMSLHNLQNIDPGTSSVELLTKSSKEKVPAHS